MQARMGALNFRFVILITPCLDKRMAGMYGWLLSKFSTLYWVPLLFVFLILVGVELPLCIVVTPLKVPSITKF